MNRVQTLHEIIMTALVLSALMCVMVAGGCSKSSPPNPAPTPSMATDSPGINQTDEEPEPEGSELDTDIMAERPDPIAEENLKAKSETKPDLSIPDAPVTGIVNGQEFALSKAALDGSVLSLTGRDERVISLVFFGPVPEQIDLFGDDLPFGSPHLVLKAGADVAASVWTSGYRLLLNFGDGEVLIDFPDDMGRVAGHFSIEGESPG